MPDSPRAIAAQTALPNQSHNDGVRRPSATRCSPGCTPAARSQLKLPGTRSIGHAARDTHAALLAVLEEEVAAAGIDVDVRHNDSSGSYSNYRIGDGGGHQDPR